MTLRCLPPRVAAGGVGEAVEVRLGSLEGPVHVLQGKGQGEGLGLSLGLLALTLTPAWKARYRKRVWVELRATSPSPSPSPNLEGEVEEEGCSAGGRRVADDLDGAPREEVGGVGAIRGEARPRTVGQVVRALGRVAHLAARGAHASGNTWGNTWGHASGSTAAQPICRGMGGARVRAAVCHVVLRAGPVAVVRVEAARLQA